MEDNTVEAEPFEFQIPVRQSNVVSVLKDTTDEALGEALGYRVDDVEIVDTVDNTDVL